MRDLMMDLTDGIAWPLEYCKTFLLVLSIIVVMFLLLTVVLTAYKSLAEKYLPKPKEKKEEKKKEDEPSPQKAGKDDDNSHFNYQHFE